MTSAPSREPAAQTFELAPLGDFQARFAALGVALCGGFTGYSLTHGFELASGEFWLTLASLLASAWGVARSLRYFEGEIRLEPELLVVPEWTLRGKIVRRIPYGDIRGIEMKAASRSILIHLRRGAGPVLVKDSLRPRERRPPLAPPAEGMSEGLASFVSALQSRCAGPGRGKASPPSPPPVP